MNSLFSKNVIVLGYLNQLKWNHYKNIYEVIQKYCNITFLKSTETLIQIKNKTCYLMSFKENELNKLNEIFLNYNVNN